MSDESRIGTASGSPSDLSSDEDRRKKRKRVNEEDNQQLELSSLFGKHSDDEESDDENEQLHSTTTLNWREHVNKILATQSDTLKEHIVAVIIPPMLRSFLKVDQREQTNARREEPVEDSEGNSSTFIPTKHRIRDTVNPSNQSRDEPEMKALVDKIKKQDEAERLRRANNDIEVGKLEVKLDLRRLRKQLFDAAVDIAIMIITVRATLMTRRRRRRNEAAKFILKDEQVSHLIARQMIKGFTQEDAEDLGLTNTTELMDEFAKYMKLDADAIKTKLSKDEGKATKEYIEKLGNEWMKLFPLITTEVFDIEDERLSKKQGEKVIEKHIKKVKAERATRDVQDELDKVDKETKVQEPLLSAMTKVSERTCKKLLRQEKSSMRKKYSGDAETETQASRPGKNGQSSSKNTRKKKNASQNKSTKSSSKKSESNQNSKGKKGKGKGKRKQVRFEESTPTPKKKNNKKSGSASKKDGNQGGSQGGGKRKSAAKR